MEDKPYLEIIEIQDREDGSAVVTMEMDMDTLKRFAGQAILQVLIDAAKKVEDEAALEK